MGGLLLGLSVYQGEYDFDVPVLTEADCYARYRLRVAEMHESLKIIEQAVAKGRGEQGGDDEPEAEEQAPEPEPEPEPVSA